MQLELLLQKKVITFRGLLEIFPFDKQMLQPYMEGAK